MNRKLGENQNGRITPCNVQKFNNMKHRQHTNEGNVLKTCTKNAPVDIIEGYNTHARKSLTIGIVQLILSPIELFYLLSFVGKIKAVIFEGVEHFFWLNVGYNTKGLAHIVKKTTTVIIKRYNKTDLVIIR
jgi:hypothetical protein